MKVSVRRLTRQQGVEIIEYGLVLAMISLALAAALGGAMGGLPDEFCNLSDRVSRLLGGPGVACGGG